MTCGYWLLAVIPIFEILIAFFIYAVNICSIIFFATESEFSDVYKQRLNVVIFDGATRILVRGGQNYFKRFLIDSLSVCVISVRNVAPLLSRRECLR